MSELTFEPCYQLDTNYDFTFIVLGAGGTGSYYIPQLARLISTVNNDKGTSHQIVIADGDVVEPKNINRQNFIAADVTKNKAEVLANRYSTAFGINIDYYPKYIETDNELQNIIYRAKTNRSTSLHRGIAPVIVGCLDTHKARQMIKRVYDIEGDIFWLDSGNEEFAGQVVLGHKVASRRCPDPTKPSLDTSKTWRFFTPCVTDMYPDILTSQEKFASELSCAERAVSNPQSIATNIMAATLLFGFTNNLISGSIEYHAVSFNSKVGNTMTSYNYWKNLEKLNPVSKAPAAPKVKAPKW